MRTLLPDCRPVLCVALCPRRLRKPLLACGCEGGIVLVLELGLAPPVPQDGIRAVQWEPRREIALQSDAAVTQIGWDTGGEWVYAATADGSVFGFAARAAALVSSA